jgi:hypothetical protein
MSDDKARIHCISLRCIDLHVLTGEAMDRRMPGFHDAGHHAGRCARLDQNRVSLALCCPCFD